MHDDSSVLATHSAAAANTGAEFSYLPTDDDREAAWMLAVRIADGAWALFGGAGVSRNSGVPIADELIDRIEVGLALPPGTLDRKDLAKACTRMECMRSRGQMVELLASELDTSARTPSRVHSLLLDLDPREILTTNAEDLWEKAFLDRATPFCVIIEGADWAKWNREHVVVVKLHGDLRRNDTLVFSELDYASYPRDEVVRAHLIDTLARCSLFFVGYRVDDANLQHEFQWVRDRIGEGSRPHFLLTDQIELWERKKFRDQLNTRVIALGSYAVIEQFLDDLRRVARGLQPEPQRRSGPGSSAVPPPLRTDVLKVLFQERYERVRTASGEWHLLDAERQLRTLLAEAEDTAERQPELAEVLKDFRQQVLLSLANVMHWRGQRAQAVEFWHRARELSELTPERRHQAAIVLANLAAKDDLVGLLDEADPSMPDYTKLRVICAWFAHDLNKATELIPAETEDIDLLSLKVRIALTDLTEGAVLQLRQDVDKMWRLAQSSPPGMIQAAELTEQLLRTIVVTGLEAAGLDRGQLIHDVRHRYRSAVERCHGIRDDVPEVFVEALASAMDFHVYLREEESVADYRARLTATPILNRSFAIAEYLIGGATADTETVEALYRAGYLSAGERAVLLSRQLVDCGLPEQAEEVLREALGKPGSTDDRQAVVETLIRLLVEQRKFVSV